jgi:hypothetical protein
LAFKFIHCLVNSLFFSFMSSFFRFIYSNFLSINRYFLISNDAHARSRPKIGAQRSSVKSAKLMAKGFFNQKFPNFIQTCVDSMSKFYSTE